MEEKVEGMETQQLAAPQAPQYKYPEQDPAMCVIKKKPDPNEDFWKSFSRAETSSEILPVEMLDTNLPNTETREDDAKAKKPTKKFKKTRKVRDAKNSDKVVEKENESRDKFGKKI